MTDGKSIMADSKTKPTTTYEAVTKPGTVSLPSDVKVGDTFIIANDSDGVVTVQPPTAQTQTTSREPVVVIAEALIPVCSDGNSDALSVASDVLEALARDGWLLVKPTMGNLPTAAPSREAPEGYTIA